MTGHILQASNYGPRRPALEKTAIEISSILPVDERVSVTGQIEKVSARPDDVWELELTQHDKVFRVILQGTDSEVEQLDLDQAEVITCAGLAEADAILLLTVMAIGVIVFQWPVGWLADHMNRMRHDACRDRGSHAQTECGARARGSHPNFIPMFTRRHAIV